MLHLTWVPTLALNSWEQKQNKEHNHPPQFQFRWSETTEEHNHDSCLPQDGSHVCKPNNTDMYEAQGSWDAAVTHLICLSLLLFLPLLLLVLLLVVALTRFPPGCSCFSLSGLPGGVPSAFGDRLPRIGGVGVRIRVYLEQGEAGGGGGDGDHCRRCHCEN